MTKELLNVVNDNETALEYVQLAYFILYCRNRGRFIIIL